MKKKCDPVYTINDIDMKWKNLFTDQVCTFDEGLFEEGRIFLTSFSVVSLQTLKFEKSGIVVC